jgi:hypothetical protein
MREISGLIPRLTSWIREITKSMSWKTTMKGSSGADLGKRSCLLPTSVRAAQR